MLDRASTFADPEIIEMLKTKFVAVAIDQGSERRQQDTEGEFYRKIASQGPRSDFESTTQGLYISDAAGKLIAYNNNRGAERIRALMRKALDGFAAPSVEPLESKRVDSKFQFLPPVGGLVVRVHTKVLRGYEPAKDEWDRIFQTAVARDNLWITATEQAELAQGRFPPLLAERLARFHLVDNTRGEPPMWKKDEIQLLDIQLKKGRIAGRAEMRTPSGSRGYLADIRGIVRAEGDRVTALECAAVGDFWGEGEFTPGAPDGKFRLAISFRLADGTDLADKVPPEGTRFWLDGYLHPQ